MSGTRVIDNKVRIQEDVMIFENSGVKIITGVAAADVADTIRDMTVNPGDIIITTEGNFNVMNENGNIGGPVATEAYVDAEGGATTIVSAGGSTTLDNTSARFILVTGTMSQTIVLPSTTSLVVGTRFVIVNRSTGVVTVSGSDLTVLVSLASNQLSSTQVLSTSTQSWSRYSIPVFNLATGSLNLNDNKIINLEEPTLAQDAATKNYVDFKNLLENVHWTITTATITFTSGAVTGNMVHVTYSDGARRVESLTLNGTNQVTLAFTPIAGSYVIIHKL